MWRNRSQPVRGLANGRGQSPLIGTELSERVEPVPWAGIAAGAHERGYKLRHLLLPHDHANYHHSVLNYRQSQPSFFVSFLINYLVSFPFSRVALAPFSGPRLPIPDPQTPI